MILSTFLLSLTLAIDAFAISVSIGVSFKDLFINKVIKIALLFGIFHTFMPILGYLTGKSFYQYISTIDHWIAFILLLFIGGKISYEAIKRCECEVIGDKKTFFTIKNMLLLAIATSVDTFAIGVTIDTITKYRYLTIFSIGISAAILSFIGFYVGKFIGCKFNQKIEIFGGVFLMLFGINILLEHKGVDILSFL